MKTLVKGHLRKMPAKLAEPVIYALALDDEAVPINDFLGQRVSLSYEGVIHCVACGRKTAKSFSQGYCYPCMRSLARCDMCIMKPEQCHYHQGTCREPAWGESHCLQPHIVYLANSSGLKVGITRLSQVPTRWIDQGATQALSFCRVSSRLCSGLVEVIIKQHMADKTSWQQMLKGKPESLNLGDIAANLWKEIEHEVDAILQRWGPEAVHYLPEEKSQEIDYPVVEYPLKITSLNLDKTPKIEGMLQGIKGQYWLLDTGVINIRKFTGYEVVFCGGG